MANDKELYYFDTLQIHVGVLRGNGHDKTLYVTIFLPGNEKENPYAEKVLGFIQSTLKNEDINFSLSSKPARQVTQSHTTYTCNEYQFYNHSNGFMYEPVCNALSEACNVFRLRWGSGDSFSNNESKLKMFTECLNSVASPSEAFPHQTFEQKLWDGINKTIMDFNSQTKEMRLNDRFLSKRLMEFAVTHPQCTVSDIERTLRTSGVLRGQIGSLVKNLAEIIHDTQEQQIKEATKAALNEFNHTSSVKVFSDKAEEIARTVAAHQMTSITAMAALLHTYDTKKECITPTKDGRRINIIDTYLAQALINAIERALKPTRDYSRG